MFHVNISHPDYKSLMSNIAIIVPARHGSTRLPAKALAKIRDKPLVWYVWRQAINCALGDVFIATDHDDIASTAKAFGANVIMTPTSCHTGSDRVAAAINTLPKNYDIIINVQGDLPFIDPQEVKKVIQPIEQGYDVGTLVTCMEESQQQNRNCVKAIVSTSEASAIHRCHWFCRAALTYGHYHLGVYAYRKDTLAHFTSVHPHPLERTESLEQLRFLTLGYTIGCLLYTSPSPRDATLSRMPSSA